MATFNKANKPCLIQKSVTHRHVTEGKTASSCTKIPPALENISPKIILIAFSLDVSKYCTCECVIRMFYKQLDFCSDGVPNDILEKEPESCSTVA